MKSTTHVQPRSVTPQQQRLVSQQQQQARQLRHADCAMQVRERGPHTGLYCAGHGVWIRWLAAAECDIIREMNVPWISKPQA